MTKHNKANKRIVNLSDSRLIHNVCILAHVLTDHSCYMAVLSCYRSGWYHAVRPPHTAMLAQPGRLANLRQGGAPQREG